MLGLVVFRWLLGWKTMTVPGNTGRNEMMTQSNFFWWSYAARWSEGLWKEGEVKKWTNQEVSWCFNNGLRKDLRVWGTDHRSVRSTGSAASAVMWSLLRVSRWGSWCWGGVLESWEWVWCVGERGVPGALCISDGVCDALIASLRPPGIIGVPESSGRL